MVKKKIIGSCNVAAPLAFTRWFAVLIYYLCDKCLLMNWSIFFVFLFWVDAHVYKYRRSERLIKLLSFAVIKLSRSSSWVEPARTIRDLSFTITATTYILYKLASWRTWCTRLRVTLVCSVGVVCIRSDRCELVFWW